MVAALLLRGLEAFAGQDSHQWRGRKLDEYLQKQSVASVDAEEQVIVRMKPAARARVLSRLQAQGVLVEGDLAKVGSVSARLKRSVLRQLEADGEIDGVSHDSPVRADGLAASVGGSALNAAYTLRRTLGVDRLGYSSTLTGRGITVAVIDSGIHRAPDFGRRIVETVDFTRRRSYSGTDRYGHGTHIAGTIGGSAPEVPGVARGVNLISLRVLDEKGQGTTSTVIRALEWAIDHKASHSIDVINMSLGHPIYEPAATDPLVQAVEAAVRAGIVVVVSAGNEGRNRTTGAVGYAGLSSPGNAPSAITVGAVRTQNTTRRTDDLVAEYSSRGPTWYDAYAKPDLVAPGHRVLAASDKSMALYKAYPVLRGPTYDRTRQYLFLSGTSMATAVTSGTVALLLESSQRTFGVKPTPNTVKAMLMSSALAMADEAGKPYDVLTQGAGALNGGGAVALAAALDPRKPLGSSWLSAGVSEFTTIDGQVLPWARQIVWGDNIVWSDAVYKNHSMWSLNVVWGENIVWSDSLSVVTKAADNIVWSDAFTWVDNIVWGDNIVWSDSDNIVWSDNDNIVWSDLKSIVFGDSDNIVWSDDDNIVWSDLDNIVWSDSILGIGLR